MLALLARTVIDGPSLEVALAEALIALLLLTSGMLWQYGHRLQPHASASRGPDVDRRPLRRIRRRGPGLETDPEPTPSLREALAPAALRAALVPGRPVFGNPWDRETDMFACFAAVTVIVPFLLWCGGELTSAIFGFGSRWSLGVFMIAALVGASGFMTIVGRERTSVTVDVLAISAWILLGLIIAPVLGLAPPAAAAIICYAVILVIILGYVLRVGRFETAFLRTVSWPITWSLFALCFAYLAYKLVLYQ